MEALVLMVVVVIVFGALGYGMYVSGKQKEAWQTAGESLGLRYYEKGTLTSLPRLEGTHRGKHVHARVRSERRGTGKNSSTVYFTRVSVRLEASCWQGLTITEHSFGDSVAKFFGGQDRKTGQERFDSDFRIKGSLGPKERDILQSSDARKVFYRLARNYQEMELDNGHIQIECQRRLTRAADLIRRIERMVDAAILLDEAAGVGDQPSGPEQQAKPDDSVLFPDIDEKPTDDAADQRPTPAPREETSSEVW